MDNCCSELQQYFPENCQHCFSRKSVASESRRKLRLLNSQNFCLLRVDDCWLTGNEHEKCDFIMFCCASKQAFLTEIKGKDILKACNQIEASYQRLPTEIKKEFTMIACIIASRVPRVNTQLARKKNEFMRKFNMQIKVQSREMTVKS